MRHAAEAAERMYIYDSPQIAKLKFALNFILPSDLIDDVTSAMLVARGITEAEFCRQTYMSDGQLRALTENGHKVGLHGHSHAPFRRLGDDVFAEVKQNQEYVALACGGSQAGFPIPMVVTTPCRIRQYWASSLIASICGLIYNVRDMERWFGKSGACETH